MGVIIISRQHFAFLLQELQKAYILLFFSWPLIDIWNYLFYPYLNGKNYWIYVEDMIVIDLKDEGQLRHAKSLSNGRL